MSLVGQGPGVISESAGRMTCHNKHAYFYLLDVDNCILIQVPGSSLFVSIPIWVKIDDSMFLGSGTKHLHMKDCFVRAKSL